MHEVHDSQVVQPATVQQPREQAPVEIPSHVEIPRSANEPNRVVSFFRDSFHMPPKLRELGQKIEELWKSFKSSVAEAASKIGPDLTSLKRRTVSCSPREETEGTSIQEQAPVSPGVGTEGTPIQEQAPVSSGVETEGTSIQEQAPVSSGVETEGTSIQEQAPVEKTRGQKIKEMFRRFSRSTGEMEAPSDQESASPLRRTASSPASEQREAVSEKQQVPAAVLKTMVQLLKEKKVGELECEGKKYSVSFDEKGIIHLQEKDNPQNCLDLTVNDQGGILDVSEGGQTQEQKTKEIPQKWEAVMKMVLVQVSEKSSTYSVSPEGEVAVKVPREVVRESPTTHARALVQSFSSISRGQIPPGAVKALDDLAKSPGYVQIRDITQAMRDERTLMTPAKLKNRESYLQTLRQAREEVNTTLNNTECKADKRVEALLADILKDLDDLIDVVSDEAKYEKNVHPIMDFYQPSIASVAPYIVKHTDQLYQLRSGEVEQVNLRTRVSYVGQRGIDQGGLSRDYFNELGEGLTTKGDVGFKDNPKLPGIRYPVTQGTSCTAKEKQQCFEIGQLMMVSYTSKSSGIVLGRHFDETVFRGALCLTAKEINTPFEDLSLKTKCKMTRVICEGLELPRESLRQLKIGLECLEKLEDGKSLEPDDLVDLIPLLSDQIVEFESIATDPVKMEDLRKNPEKCRKLLEKYKNEIPEVLKDVVLTPAASRLAPLHAIGQGMKSFAPSTASKSQDQYWEIDMMIPDKMPEGVSEAEKTEIQGRREEHLHKISDRIQGSVDSEAVAKAITLSDDAAKDPTLKKKVEWLREWVRELNPQELRQFLQWVTGTQGYGGQPITIVARTDRLYPIPTVHTCFSQLDISPGKTSGGKGQPRDDTQEGFIHYVQLGMGSATEGFSIG